jgi:hypothetical protein
MTRLDLLDVVYRFHPRGVEPLQRDHVPPGERVYDDTEEHLRLMDAARHGGAAYATWQAMIRRLEDRYVLQDESLHLLGGSISSAYSSAYSARVFLDDRVLTFHVSLLGPFYGVHRTGVAADDPVASDIAREIEATYPGYEPIPPELGKEVVPDVAMDAVMLGEATIHVCLLSLVWTWGTGPLA